MKTKSTTRIIQVPEAKKNNTIRNILIFSGAGALMWFLFSSFKSKEKDNTSSGDPNNDPNDPPISCLSDADCNVRYWMYKFLQDDAILNQLIANSTDINDFSAKLWAKAEQEWLKKTPMSDMAAFQAKIDAVKKEILKQTAMVQMIKDKMVTSGNTFQQQLHGDAVWVVLDNLTKKKNVTGKIAGKGIPGRTTGTKGITGVFDAPQNFNVL